MNEQSGKASVFVDKRIGEQNEDLGEFEFKERKGVFFVLSVNVRRIQEFLTASADHSIKLWDFEQKECSGMLKDLVSGSRDGSFALWDLRSNAHQGRDWISPNEQVNEAHTSAKRKRFIKGKAASMTVTSVLYLKDEVSIATVGAIDGVVKLWDTQSLRVPASQACPLHESTTETNENQTLWKLGPYYTPRSDHILLNNQAT